MEIYILPGSLNMAPYQAVSMITDETHSKSHSDDFTKELWDNFKSTSDRTLGKLSIFTKEAFLLLVFPPRDAKGVLDQTINHSAFCLLAVKLIAGNKLSKENFGGSLLYNLVNPLNFHIVFFWPPLKKDHQSIFSSYYLCQGQLWAICGETVFLTLF